MFISDNVSITKPVSYTAAGTSTVTTTVDTQGYDGMLVLVSLGTEAANNGLKLGQGALANGSDATDLAASHQYGSGSIVNFVEDLLRPGARYVTISVLRGTSTTIEAVWVILYNARNVPVTNAATTLAVLKLETPATGTA